MAIGQELLNVPMGDMIRQMAFAIAEGQAQLDASSVEVAEMMGGLKAVYDSEGTLSFNDSRVFFGHEWMSIKEAKAYLIADAGLSATERDAMIDQLKKAEQVATNADESKTLVRVPVRLSMLELGFTPTFYQFVDTIIEVKIAIKITQESTSSSVRKDASTGVNVRTATQNGGLWGLIRGGQANNSSNSNVVTSQVDASYASKYSYSAEGASLLRTKLAPVPPPAVLEERVRRMMDEDAARRRKRLEEMLPAPTPTTPAPPAPAPT